VWGHGVVLLCKATSIGSPCATVATPHRDFRDQRIDDSGAFSSRIRELRGVSTAFAYCSVICLSFAVSLAWNVKYKAPAAPIPATTCANVCGRCPPGPRGPWRLLPQPSRLLRPATSEGATAGEVATRAQRRRQPEAASPSRALRLRSPNPVEAASRRVQSTLGETRRPMQRREQRNSERRATTSWPFASGESTPWSVSPTAPRQITGPSWKC